MPLSFIGGILGLLAMNAVLSFFAILGFFSLAGITIINNGIVLIDRIDAEIAAGKAAYDAVIGAALARFPADRHDDADDDPRPDAADHLARPAVLRPGQPDRPSAWPSARS